MPEEIRHGKKEYSYSRELKKQLEEDVYLRHLFNKLGKEVIVDVKGTHIIGILRTIQFIKGILNIEIEDTNNTWFINWKYVKYIRVRK